MDMLKFKKRKFMSLIVTAMLLASMFAAVAPASADNAAGNNQQIVSGNASTSVSDSVYVTAVAPISVISVAYGTALGSVPLPAIVGVTLSNSDTGSATVSWNTSIYNGSVAGAYNLPGTLSGLPDGSTNKENLTPSVIVIVAPAQFTDVPGSFWAYGDIEKLSGLGYISGYPDGTFRPNNLITRAEFVTVMDKVLNLTTYTPQTPSFTDINPGDWFDQAVETAVYRGIAKGYGDGTFRPNAPISRQEVCAVLENALGKNAQALADANAKTGFADDASISSWARGFVVLAVQDELIKGYSDGGFEPLNNTTRAETSAMVSNFLKVYTPPK